MFNIDKLQSKACYTDQRLPYLHFKNFKLINVTKCCNYEGTQTFELIKTYHIFKYIFEKCN